MEAKALIALVLALRGYSVPHPHDGHYEYASQVAFLIREAVRAEHAEALRAWRRGQRRPEAVSVDIVAAVFQKESSNRIAVRDGAAGEVGIGQIKVDGQAVTVCSDLLERLREPRVNALCAVRLLRAARASCPDKGPLEYLGRYNGIQVCGETAYSRKVLDLLERARPRVVAAR